MIRMGVVFLLLMGSEASATSPEICRPYARLTTDNIIREVWMRSYNHCMNLEDDHPIPPETWKGLLEVLDSSPPRPVERPITYPEEPPGEVPAAGPPADDVPVTPQPSAEPTGKSGFASGTPEWVKWCKRNYRSFNAKTGNVITLHPRRTKSCPG